MRVAQGGGSFELVVVREEGLQPLPEVSSGGKHYAVAAPGVTYQVRFAAFVSPQPGYSFLVELTVDGRAVGYVKTLDSPYTSHPSYFQGFLQRSDANYGTATYISFQFAQPQEDGAKAVTGLNFSEGKLVCKVWHAVPSNRQASATFMGPALTDAKVAAMPEGKKFFMAPSLTTGTGAVKPGPALSTTYHDKVGDAPVAVLDLHYETAPTLLLRKVLNPANCAHKRIIDEFGGPRQQDDEDEGEASTGNRASGKRKAEPGLQREQQRRGQQQQQGEEDSDTIDLTGGPAPWRPRPNDPLLAAKREHKELVCDLTGEAERPRWKENKKVKQEIRL